MRFKRRRRAHSGIEASSLSDILFFLMLFFLMISTLASPNAIKILLPRADNSNTRPPHEKINLYIDATGNVFIEKNPTSYDALEGQLTEESKKHPDLSIVIRADKSVTVEELVKVVDVANHLHLPVVVATEHTK